MSNIWFLRTDRDTWSKVPDISHTNETIFSSHGICNPDKEIVNDHYSKIFPKLLLSKTEVRKTVRSIKSKLVEADKLNLNQNSKKRCDVAICYWIAIMQEGDIVFVRNQKKEIFICEIKGYISEAFFNEHGFFQRPVKILQKVTADELHEKILKRTKGRKALERNAKKVIKHLVNEHLRNIDAVVTSTSHK